MMKCAFCLVSQREHSSGFKRKREFITTAIVAPFRVFTSAEAQFLISDGQSKFTSRTNFYNPRLPPFISQLQTTKHKPGYFHLNFFLSFMSSLRAARPLILINTPVRKERPFGFRCSRLLNRTMKTRLHALQPVGFRTVADSMRGNGITDVMQPDQRGRLAEKFVNLIIDLIQSRTRAF